MGLQNHHAERNPVSGYHDFARNRGKQLTHRIDVPIHSPDVAAEIEYPVSGIGTDMLGDKSPLGSRRPHEPLKEIETSRNLENALLQAPAMHEGDSSPRSPPSPRRIHE